MAACATDDGLRWELEPARAVAEESCESVAGLSRVVLEAEGRQVVLPTLPRREPVPFSQSEFEHAMRLLVAQLPGPPQPLFHRPGKTPRLSAAWRGSQQFAWSSPCSQHEAPFRCVTLREPELHLGEEERADMALMFAFESLWPGVQSVVEASVDPEQLKIAVYTSLSTYLGLLLLPEPTSKLIALGMTVTLIAYLGANTLFNVVEGYRQLQAAVRSARSLLELRSIGERYGRVLGEQVGRVLVLVATAALGWTAHGMMRGPGLPGFGRAAHLLKAEMGLDLLAVARQVQAVVVARPAVTVTLTPTAAYMAQQGMSGSQGVHASASVSSEGPAPKRHRIEQVEEWREPRLTPDGRVLPYKGTRQPPQPIAILGRNRAGKTVTNGKETVRFGKHGFAEFETKFETLIDDVHIGSSSHRMHFKAANQRLHEAVRADPRLARELNLSPGEIEALPTSTAAPSGYTWHHHQDVCRMQLITDGAHQLARPHTGGMSIWGGGYQ
ncbi:HNH endonuclease [Archangium violaceum]|uniref:SitA5 family polymorphic toxin n=1 Tax=Archangium violaceum TaxID=83451 RepID=UPI002286B4A8|nr:HNH endonuclease [Archangium violaceum]